MINEKVKRIISDLKSFNEVVDPCTKEKYNTRGFNFESRGHQVYIYDNPYTINEIAIYISKTNATSEEDVVLNRTFTRDSILRIIVSLSALIGEDINNLLGETEGAKNE